MKLSKITGFTLFELLLALSIFGLVLLMATRYFSVDTTNAKITRTTQDIVAIRQAAAEWVLAQPDYKGGSTDCSTAGSNCISFNQLNAAGLLPSSLSNGLNPWGYPYAISPSQSNPTQLTIATATFDNCSAIKNILQSQAASAECTGLKNSILSITFN
jgi:prepilin-type N-terminal cleavage/methylation domain-containing protein